jgi:hypothetical protein
MSRKREISKSTVFHFREEQALLDEAQRIADAEGTTLSSILRRLLRSWVNQQRRTAMHSEHNATLPIDGRVFTTSLGKWTASVLRWPIPPQNSTVLLFEVEFKGPSTRRLKLWVPGEIEPEKRQQEAFEDVQRWLETQNGDGELRSCFS